jgi:hypothetical protein
MGSVLSVEVGWRCWMMKMMKLSGFALAPGQKCLHMCLGILMCAGLLAGGLAPVMAQSFSADILTVRNNTAVPAGRLRVLDDRVRIETTELPNAFFLVDASKPSAYFVRPAMHIYMDARQSSRLTQLFVPVDPNDPCGRWQVMAQLAGIAGQGDWRCERMGTEAVDGRTTIVFRAFSGSDQEYLGWIDPVRRFPLRIETEGGSALMLENIRDEVQPASSFELPADLRKFSPEALVEQIKQSDVWVSEPKQDASSNH